MLKFNDKELEWIKNEITYALAPENKECVEYVDEEDLAKAKTVLDKIELVNTDEIINEMCLDVLSDMLQMWIWNERLCNPVEEISEFIKDDTYCEIFRKLMESEGDC